MTETLLDYLKRWWQAIRPHSLGTAIAPVLVGGGLAAGDGAFRLSAFTLATAGVAGLLIGVNLANDYFDYRSGADPPIGIGTRPLQRGLLSPRSFLIGGLAAIIAAGAIGLVLARSSPSEVLSIGVVGAVLGFFYTAPPLRLGYRGFGEIVVFICLGPLAVAGSYAVISGRSATGPVLVAALPIAFTVTALLHANNIRDLVQDKRTEKCTLAVRFGLSVATVEYRALIGAAVLSTLAIAIAVNPFAIPGLLVAPQASQLMRSPVGDPSTGGPLMRKTATLNTRLAVLLALGYALRSVIPGIAAS